MLDDAVQQIGSGVVEPGQLRVEDRLVQPADVLRELPVARVQPIDDGNFLLVTPGIYEAMRDKRNGDVWNSEGRLIGKILLGDGINNVQTSVRSEVWVGYHDEGVYGAGEPGLACFDAAGKRVFSFADSVADDDRVPVIDDCYALNVAADDDVWVYYFKAFPLVRLVDKRLGAIWPDTPGVGAHAFAVGERTVLFAGDYGAPSSLTRYFPESGRSEMGHAIATATSWTSRVR